jgi:hypothetical protein
MTFLKGNIPWNNRKRGLQVGYWKGKTRTQEAKNKMSISAVLLGRTGNKASGWKGGISIIDRLCRRMPEYYQWRSDIFKRDNWTCQTCHTMGIYVTVHHIKGFSKLLQENNIKDITDARNCPVLWDLTNGITLCEKCHRLTDNYRGRGVKKYAQ